MSKNPLRILITDPHTDGGGQVRYIQSLAGELVRQGHEVRIGCRERSVLAGIAREAGCGVVDAFHFARGLRPARWAHDIRLMRSLLVDSPPDLVHTNGSQDHWVAGMTRGLFCPNARIVRTRHNTYPVKRGLANRLLNTRWTVHQIAVCEMVRATLAAHPAFDAGRLTAIHNGVDISRFKPDPRIRAQARADFGYTETDLVCGIVARLVEAKGHRYLFEAAAQIREAVPALRILVLGQGVLEGRLKDQVRRLGLEDHVQFAGFRNDMEVCVQAMDVGVLPSVDCDTSSFSLKEQMAAGLPVIASDYGGLPEIVTSGVEGLIVPSGRVEPLAAAIGSLGKDPALRRRMGERGRERVVREFSLEAFARRTVEVYRNAMEWRP